MLKKALFVVAVVAILGAVAQAGETKIHNWPYTKIYTAQEIPGLEIPVKMDIGYWVHIKDQGDISITLVQQDLHTYQGSDTMTVECNFNVTLIPEISPVGTVVGDFGVAIEPADIPEGGGSTTLTATLTNANLGAYSGGTTGVQVAKIKIKVLPTGW